jgi:hypothetical protein
MEGNDACTWGVGWSQADPRHTKQNKNKNKLRMVRSAGYCFLLPLQFHTRESLPSQILLRALCFWVLFSSLEFI